MAGKKEESGKRPVGKQSGVGIVETWVQLFEANEKAPKAKRMTDDEISKAMHTNFKGRASKVFDAVNAVRSRYNHGALTRGVAPKTLSLRYDENGEVVESAKRGANLKKGAKGKKVGKKELKKMVGKKPLVKRRAE